MNHEFPQSTILQLEELSRVSKRVAKSCSHYVEKNKKIYQLVVSKRGSWRERKRDERNDASCHSILVDHGRASCCFLGLDEFESQLRLSLFPVEEGRLKLVGVGGLKNVDEKRSARDTSL